MSQRDVRFLGVVELGSNLGLPEALTVLTVTECGHGNANSDLGEQARI